MNTDTRERVAAVLDQLARTAIEYCGHSDGASVDFSLKADGSRVTNVDKAIEQAWRCTISEEFPDHSIVGEELAAEFGRSAYCWYLDPLDGTDDFSRGIPLFGYIVALTLDGAPVAAAMGHPALGIEFRSISGQGASMNGRELRLKDDRSSQDTAISIPAMEDFLRQEDRSSVQISLARRFPNFRVYRNLFGHTSVLIGALDAAVEFDVAPWDILATQLMICEAGGHFCSFRAATGKDGIEKRGVAFGKHRIVSEICRVVSHHGYNCECD